MATTNIYLYFDGNCESVFQFYRSVFGGEFSYNGKYKDMPPSDRNDPADAERTMHIALPISKETMIMGGDFPSSMSSQYRQGSNFSISVTVDSKEEADRIFQALSAGGTVSMPIGETFWGDYFGMCNDAFGIGWMVSYALPKAS